jgi:hypothetical protein
MNSVPAQKVSLQVILNGKVIFQSHKQWLFPLFDLEDYLKKNPISLANAEVRDKVIGKAAALLILRLGAGRVHGDVMSEIADNALSRAGTTHTFDKLVKRIDCQTEEILFKIDDPEAAHTLLCKRAKRR